MFLWFFKVFLDKLVWNVSDERTVLVRDVNISAPLWADDLTGSV